MASAVLMLAIFTGLAYWLLSSPTSANVFMGGVMAYSLLAILVRFVPGLKDLWLKINLILTGAHFFIFSNDASGMKKVPDTGSIQGSVVSQKRLILIRHGESKWNEVFNKGFGPKFIVRLVKAVIGEVTKLPTNDSVFYDAPLNSLGQEQAGKLSDFVTVGAETSDLRILKGEEPSIIVSSNLRRCLQTIAIGLNSRLRGSGERIFVLSSLQEIARNVDTMSVAEPAGLPPLEELKRLGFDPREIFDASYNQGNKTIEVTGVKRMGQFFEWIFARPDRNIIVSGHSLWFRNFCRAYLPQSSSAECKAKKLVNAGALAVTVEAVNDGSGNIRYRIDPDSVSVVYGGFVKK